MYQFQLGKFRWQGQPGICFLDNPVVTCQCRRHKSWGFVSCARRSTATSTANQDGQRSEGVKVTGAGLPCVVVDRGNEQVDLTCSQMGKSSVLPFSCSLCPFFFFFFCIVSKSRQLLTEDPPTLPIPLLSIRLLDPILNPPSERFYSSGIG